MFERGFSFTLSTLFPGATECAWMMFTTRREEKTRRHAVVCFCPCLRLLFHQDRPFWRLGFCVWASLCLCVSEGNTLPTMKQLELKLIKRTIKWYLGMGRVHTHRQGMRDARRFPYSCLVVSSTQCISPSSLPLISLRFEKMQMKQVRLKRRQHHTLLNACLLQMDRPGRRRDESHSVKTVIHFLTTRMTTIIEVEAGSILRIVFAPATSSPWTLFLMVQEKREEEEEEEGNKRPSKLLAINDV